jgi:prepilin-type processing-associated H-X9-DG protein
VHPIAEEGISQAVWSLVFGILSFACLSIFGSIPAVMMGHSALYRVRSGLMPARAWGLAVAGLVLGYLNIATTMLGVILFFVLTGISLSSADWGATASASRSTCQNNLKQMGLVYMMYAGENRGEWPPLSPIPGRLMPKEDAVFPKYLTDLNVTVCPADRNAPNPVASVDDESYIYLGYVLENEGEALAFCKSYKELVAQGLPFGNDLKVNLGEGNGRSDTIYPFKEGVERFLITDINDSAAASTIQSIVPVMIEWPGHHGRPPGGNVLYMDGHVEYLAYPGKWPMTPGTIGALTEIAGR